jgi:hypothetical protein
MNAQPIAHVYEMPRKKPETKPGERPRWDGDLTALGDALGVKDLAQLERILAGDEAAPRDLAIKIKRLTGYEVEVRAPGRPRKITHPLAIWIDQHRDGDRARFAEEIGCSLGYLRNVLSNQERLSVEKARAIKRITGLSLDILLDFDLP